MNKLVAVCGLLSFICTAIGSESLSLDGVWDFRFEEGKSIEDVSLETFKPTDAMSVPGCFDAMPKWQMKRGTGMYRRTFVLDRTVEDSWLVVDGLGLRGDIRIDGRKLGVYPYPYARLEIPVGKLSAGEHEISAAIDNRLDYSTMKLGRDFYDFYLYGGIYRGVTLKFDNRRLFVRTRDIRTGLVEIEAVNFEDRDFGTSLVFDGKHKVDVGFKNGRVAVQVPDFKLWSPDAPNLHTVSLTSAGKVVSAKFGIRTIEAKDRRILLNGKPVFLKGVNRHEQCQEFGAATTVGQMVRDIQILKDLGANFVRGAHYQQDQRFLDLCDEYGLLVWEESLGWGNGQHYTREGTIEELKDPEFCDQQVCQTRMMVRESFNHPCVIIFSFLNEPASGKKECKELVDKLISTIRAEDSGRLVTFACCTPKDDICNENTDIVAYNRYPRTIPAQPGSPESMRAAVIDCFNSTTALFRKRYPNKPIMVSECGVSAIYGQHDPLAAFCTEEFQDEYLTDIFDALWPNDDVVGFSIWQFTDTNTNRRNNVSLSRSGRLLGISIAGIVDFQRRPKKSFETVRKYFRQK